MLKNLELIHKGKVRDIYRYDKNHLLIHTTDRISAYDSVLPTPIPGKGAILTKLTRFWAEEVRRIIPNHISRAYANLNALSAYFPERDSCQVVLECKPIKIEAVVRGYLFGSSVESYKKTGKVSGVYLPPNLNVGDRLPTPVFTPTLKVSDGGHDTPITYTEMRSMIGEKLAKEIRGQSLSLYKYAKDLAIDRGIIIADTKFEFGLNSFGELLLIDEILTPDSSRFWDVNLYDKGSLPVSMDKQIVRDYIAQTGEENLPESIVNKTLTQYEEVYNRLVHYTNILGSIL